MERLFEFLGILASQSVQFRMDVAPVTMGSGQKLGAVLFFEDPESFDRVVEWLLFYPELYAYSFLGAEEQSVRIVVR